MYIYSSTLLPFFNLYFILFRVTFRLAWMLNLISKAWFPLFWLAFTHASFVFVPSKMCFFSWMFNTRRFSTLKEVALILFLLFGLNVCAQFEWEPLHRVSAGEKRCLQKRARLVSHLPDVGFCPHSSSQSHRCHFIWKIFVIIDVWIWSRRDKSEKFVSLANEKYSARFLKGGHEGQMIWTWEVVTSLPESIKGMAPACDTPALRTNRHTEGGRNEAWFPFLFLCSQLSGRLCFMAQCRNVQIRLGKTRPGSREAPSTHAGRGGGVMQTGFGGARAKLPFQSGHLAPRNKPPGS